VMVIDGKNMLAALVGGIGAAGWHQDQTRLVEVFVEVGERLFACGLTARYNHFNTRIQDNELRIICASRQGLVGKLRCAGFVGVL
jgi:hypothetical protein